MLFRSRLVGPRRVVPTSPGSTLLLDHLADRLGEPQLAFAGSARPCREFVTPVLQLLRPDGRTIAFAKLGWDPVTDAMVDTEADALAHIAGRSVDGLRVPEVVWHGRWNDRSVLVTAPMPARVRRRGSHAPIPIEPLRALAAVDGPVASMPLRTSAHWAAARETVALAADSRLTDRQIGRAHV